MAKLTPALRQAYLQKFQTARISPAHQAQVNAYVARIRPNVPRYEAMAKRLHDLGEPVPAWLLMTTMALEANGNLNCCFHNGQPLNKKTTIVPKGRGPFTGADAWEKSVIDSLFVVEKDLIRIVNVWDLAECLWFEEAYNGFGYFARNINTPYLWSWTQHYARGRYVADGKFSPTSVSQQAGVVSILKGLIQARLVVDPLTVSQPLRLAKNVAAPEEAAQILYSLADRPTRPMPGDLITA